MQVPLTIAAPAAVATLAYLSARTQLPYDYRMLKVRVKNKIKTARLERQDRVNIFYTLESHALAKSTANHAFIVYEGTTWTYNEVYDIVLRYAAWLKANYSIAPKEIVALDFMNSPKFVFIWLALWSLGAHPAFINYNLTGKPLLHCIKCSTARIVFVDDEVEQLYTPEVRDALGSMEFRDGKGSVEVITLGPALEAIALSTAGVREPDSARGGVTATGLALLIYTSGTTGLPKPAVCSWAKFTGGGDVLAGLIGWTREDRIYSPMPLYHGTAAILGFVPCLQIGATFVIGHKFSINNFWPEVRASKATVIQYVGETCRYLLAAPPQLDPISGENLDSKNDVRMAFGNGLRPDVWNRFKERFGIETIGEFYAATEAVSTHWNVSSNSFSAGAIGRFGLLIKLFLAKKQAVVEVDWETETPYRDPKRNNFCTRVKAGLPGELLHVLDPADIKAAFPGYFNNEKASDSKIMRDVFTKGDAWFRTGDVMRIDDENRVYFCDRIGDTFRWKSQNVSTSEIMEILGLHPSVKDANVYGVELPSHDGRAGCAATVFDREVDGQLLDGVAAHLSRQLPKYAVPLFLRVTKEIQSTGNNKQQKHILRKEGVEPGKVHADDKIYWLRGGTYVEFRDSDWKALQAGAVKL